MERPALSRPERTGTWCVASRATASEAPIAATVLPAVRFGVPCDAAITTAFRLAGAKKSNAESWCVRAVARPPSTRRKPAQSYDRLRGSITRHVPVLDERRFHFEPQPVPVEVEANLGMALRGKNP